MMTPRPLPPCPKCRRADRVEEEDQSGSSARWFACLRCGMRFLTRQRLGERRFGF
jgi:hypothetical protein